MASDRGLAERIVTDSRTYLCMDLRFMTRAVMSMDVTVEEGAGKCTFSERGLRFFSDTVLREYAEEPNSVTRHIAHMILHLVLGHSRGHHDTLRALAEDIIVEHALDVLDTAHTSVSDREGRDYYFGRILMKTGSPSVELFAEDLSKASEWGLSTYSDLFSPDDHPVLDPDGDPAWKEISQQMKVEIEGFTKNLGSRASMILEILRIRNRRRTDHRRFLRNFMTSSERVHVDPDSFDPAYYVLGLETYGNIPLIDPAEYSDVPVMEEFVIAVDTSGSTSGELVRSFMDEVYSLMEQCGICRDTEIHIVQCDDRIRDDRIIRSRGDLREFLGGIELRGGEGTDFRPVFGYVDGLVAEGKMRRPRGLLYFTDGMGIYPQKGPEYPVAFMFVDDRYRERPVPGWAMRVTVGSEDIVQEAVPAANSINASEERT